MYACSLLDSNTMRSHGTGGGAMARDELSAVDAWRRKEKKKAAVERRRQKQERFAALPAHKLDVSALLDEVLRLGQLEHEGRLNSDMRLHKKHLIDRYHRIRKARAGAGLETPELREFDAEAYEARKAAQRPKRPLPSSTEPHLDERGFPLLPEGPAPSAEELAALGLPPYLEGVDLLLDGDDMEAALAQEYELFQASLQEDA